MSSGVYSGSKFSLISISRYILRRTGEESPYSIWRDPKKATLRIDIDTGTELKIHFIWLEQRKTPKVLRSSGVLSQVPEAVPRCSVVALLRGNTRSRFEASPGAPGLMGGGALQGEGSDCSRWR